MSDFQAKMHQNRLWLGLHPRPRWGSIQRSPDPLAGFKEPTSKERKGEGRDGKADGMEEREVGRDGRPCPGLGKWKGGNPKSGLDNMRLHLGSHTQKPPKIVQNRISQPNLRNREIRNISNRRDYWKCKIRWKVSWIDHVTYNLEFCDSLYISETVEASNFKFAMRSINEKMRRRHVTYFWNIETPYISREQVKLKSWNLACIETTRALTNVKLGRLKVDVIC